MLNKNFLSLDGTKDVVLFKYVVREQNEELDKKQDELQERMGGQKQKASIPKIFSILQLIFLAIGAILIISLIRACDPDVDFFEFFFRTWWLWACALVSLAIAFIIERIEKKKENEVVESSEFKEITEEMVEVEKKSYDALAIPENAIDTDFFITYFKLNKSGKRVRPSALMMFESANTEFKLFVEDEKLCLADMSMVVGIPLSSITGIEKINKSMTFTGWNKSEAFNSEKYKPYKLKTNSYGVIFVKPYYLLKFNLEDKEYALYFPSYELSTVLSLTGLKDPDEQEVQENKEIHPRVERN
ncbi:MAG: hypothetical protein J6C23_08160 [Clostridia bacterium]|nr:hypothetical protein [Clostridia bacterium]